MKHKLFFLLFLFVLMPICVEAQEAPQHRVVYLWDVTYSMHGGFVTAGVTESGIVVVGGKSCTISHYDKSKDIYDKILNALVADINKQRSNTEIVVIPFGKKVLGKWSEIATEEGKTRIIKNIEDFCNIQPDDVQKTGISCALDYSQTNRIFSTKVPNTLKILTDGVENVSTSRLYHILDNWCNYAEANHIRAYYFILAEQALRVDLRKRLEDNCITVIEQLDDVELAVSKSYVSVIPDEILVKLAEKKDINDIFVFKINFTAGKVGAKCDLQFSVEENPYFSLNETVKISEETKEVQLRPNYKMTLEEFRKNAPLDSPTNLPINIKVLNDEEEVELQGGNWHITIVNKKLKSLKISVK